MTDTALSQLIVKAAWFDLYSGAQTDMYKLASALQQARQEVSDLKAEKAAEKAANHPDAAKVAKTKGAKPAKIGRDTASH
jgi:hypothetical protein